MGQVVKKHLESRMLGNLHVRFGVGAGVKFPGPHHVSCDGRQLAEVKTTSAGNDKLHARRGRPRLRIEGHMACAHETALVRSICAQKWAP